MPTHDIDATAPLMGQLRTIGIPEHLPIGRTMLYRFLDAAGQILYLGITVSPRGRWQAHKKRAVWWDAVRQVRVEWHPHERAALDAEVLAIRSESPPHNIRSSSRSAHARLMRTA